MNSSTHYCSRVALPTRLLKPVAHNQNPHEEKELDFLLLRPIGLFIHLDGFDVVPSYGDISCRNICRLLNIMVQCCVVHKELISDVSFLKSPSYLRLYEVSTTKLHYFQENKKKRNKKDPLHSIHRRHVYKLCHSK